MEYIHKDHVLDEIELPVGEANFISTGGYDLFGEDGECDGEI